MAAGLVLTTLAGAGAATYRSGNAVFDLAKIYESKLRMQVAQALDLGFQCRNGTALMADTASMLENAASRGVRFFSIGVQAFRSLNSAGAVPHFCVRPPNTVPCRP